MKRWVARIGPRVCEFEGPKLAFNKSKTLTNMESPFARVSGGLTLFCSTAGGRGKQHVGGGV